MVVFKKEGLSKSEIVTLEIYSDIYTIYLNITKHKTLPLAFDLCTCLQDYQFTIRTSCARLNNETNTLFAIEIKLDV